VEQTPKAVRRADDAPGLVEDELVDYCARPSCRQEFRRSPGPGRKQAYCSEICRRTAEREYRKTAQRLAHFEGVVEQLRLDVGAFGRSTEEPTDVHDAMTHRAAEAAVARAGGVLLFLTDSTDQVAAELRALHEAVAPVVRSS